jgi:hypothetical protein
VDWKCGNSFPAPKSRAQVRKWRFEGSNSSVITQELQGVEGGFRNKQEAVLARPIGAQRGPLCPTSWPGSWVSGDSGQLTLWSATADTVWHDGGVHYDTSTPTGVSIARSFILTTEPAHGPCFQSSSSFKGWGSWRCLQAVDYSLDAMLRYSYNVMLMRLKVF